MGKKHEEEIEQKLRELEISMKEATNANVPAAIQKSKELSGKTSQTPAKPAELVSSLTADLHLLGGSALMIVGLFVLFSHLRVSIGGMSSWGFGGLGGFGGGVGGTGALILVLLIGMGVIFYDYKNKIGWLMVVCSLLALVIFLFASMHLMLMPMDLLSLLLLFMPWVIGGALLAKGMRIHTRVNAQKSHDK